MGEIVRGLIREEQEELFEILVAVSLNVIFLVVIALLLWALGSPLPALRMAKGYVVLWVVSIVICALVLRVQSFFRVNLYDRPDAYTNSNLVASCLLQVGWSAFAALTVHASVAGAPTWFAVVLYLVGVLSCLVAFFVVSSFYRGHVYKFISLPLALVCFVVFSTWGAGARALFGRLYDLF